MSEGRDPAVLYTNDSFAYSKRTHGFVPWTEFYTEETANVDLPKETLWFDHRQGNSGELVEGGKPSFIPEVTDSDMYAYRHRFGMFSSIPYVKRTAIGDLRALLRLGYKLPSPHKVLIRMPDPVWPPMDDVELTISERRWFMYSNEDRRAREAEIEKRKSVAMEIAVRCPMCAMTSPFLVWKDKVGYAHGTDYFTAKRCAAHRLHEKRMTETPRLREPKKQKA